MNLEKTTALAAILRNERGDVILQLRDNHAKFFPNTWSVITGGMKPIDKTPEAGIRREIGRELYALGKSLEPHDLRLFSDKYTYKDEQQDCRQYVYTGELYLPEEQRWLTLEDITLNEGQDIGIFTPEQIRSMHIGANYGQILEAVFQHEIH